MTAASMLAKEWAWTPVKRSERRIELPETMQPPETSELIACPRRWPSSWMNLAGGVISA